MKRIVVPISKGFEEIECISIIDVCRRAGIEVLIASLDEILVQGANGIKIEANCLLKDIDSKDFDMIVLPGGLPNAYTLAENEKVLSLLKEFKEDKKEVAAICAAPLALFKAGVLNENYTCYPSFEKEIKSQGYTKDKKVVVDGRVITSRGPGTAICFGLEIVKTLCKEEVYRNVKEGLLVDFC